MKHSRAIEVSRSRKGCLYLLLTLVIILIPSSPSKFSASKAGNGGSFSRSTITLANASYLEDVGRLTEVMNQFVDVFLEKVSFLAEIIIQSAMEEQCSIGEQIECQPDGDKKRGSSKSPYGDNMALDSIVEDGEKFDKLEYTNLTSFVKSIKAADIEPSSPSSSSSFNNDNNKRSSSCKLFNFAVEKQDLPVNSMEICCSNFENCYTECGKKKLDCDLQFQQCLKSMCKQNFDYTNETLLQQMHHVLRRDALMNEPLASDDDSDDLDDSEGRDDDDDAYDEDEENDNEEGDGKGESNETKRSAKRCKGSASSETNNKSAGEEKLAAFKARKGKGGGKGELGGERGKRDASIEVNSRQVKRLKDKYKACKLAIKVLIIGNLAFGCQTYKQSQWSACCLIKHGETSKEEGKGKVVDEKGNREGGGGEGNMNLGEAGGKVDTALTALQGLPGDQQTFSATATITASTATTTTTIDGNTATS